MKCGAVACVPEDALAIPGSVEHVLGSGLVGGFGGDFGDAFVNGSEYVPVDGLVNVIIVAMLALSVAFYVSSRRAGQHL